ncbi:type I phosphomannose isomerase catalytic subunit [Deinococcus sonorensis]|uniref:Type I phosphomannose isomerase catalytic subunit n=2 Tax=Deinococcus sonorensis TaxID=309891 RepID=A0AAU7UEB3_9DEIO
MTHSPLSQQLLPLVPEYKERVWGGQRLQPHTPPIGEAWIAGEDSRVAAGPLAGQTLHQLVQAAPQALLGEHLAGRYTRFPLLIKLLDCADWLSVQVHPNDEQARQLVGEGQFGKTEAWHFLEVEPGAEIIVGVQAGTTPAQLAAAIRGGEVLDVSARQAVQAGDTVYIPAGTLHALGPGMLLYEVQQSSDTTYRVYDWDRPANAGRALHLEESVAVTDAGQQGDVRGVGQTGGQGELVRSPYFVLEGLHLNAAQAADTGGRSPHLLTVTEGEVQVQRGEERVRLRRYDTLLVAASAGGYRLEADQPARLLRASVPEA